MAGFIFGSGTSARTPEELARQRRWAQVMRQSVAEERPQNVWDGIGSIAKALSANFADYKAQQEEDAGRRSASDKFRSIFSSFSNDGNTSGSSTLPEGARIDATRTAFLDTLAGPESGGGYNKLYGGGDFNGYADHPRQNIPITSGPNMGKTTSAAGKYQFLGPTWDEQKKKLKLPDFSPESQDAAAWDLASSTYNKATGGNLGHDLTNADGDLIKKIAGLVSGKWTSMPGGIEQTVTGDDFLSSYNQNLAKQRQIQPASFTGSANIGTTSQAQTPGKWARNPDDAAAPGYASGAPAVQPAGNTQASGPGLNELLQAYSDPWASEEQKSVLQMYIQQEMQKADPARQQQLEKGQLEIDALKNPPSEYGFEVLPDGRMVRTDKRKGTATPIMQSEQKPTNDMQNYEAYAADERAAGRQPLGRLEYERALKKAGATNINNNLGGEKFGEEFAKGDAKALSDVSQSGLSAQRNIARINRLDDLLTRAPQGATAAWKQWAGEYGINTEGLDNIQSAQALINALVPEQRPPGSGPMSDADLILFKQSLPRLINQPGGNTLIINTIRAVAQYDAEGATIVQKLRRGEIDRATAFDMLQSRVNPLDQLNDLPTVNDIDAELKKRGVQ
jgi:muramidase (phage lysozyme)